jgi:cyclopropane fatty-acyl-phospholipid synthase-like methyltransferase
MPYDPAAMQNHPSAQIGFSKIYQGNPPWDIGKPQPPFMTIADQVSSPVLDAGCGTGSTALFFAAMGHQVTGIDFVEEAIRRAQAKAAERGLTAEFLVKDAMTLGEWDKRFATVIDSGLFHVYDGDERRCYVQGLANVIQPGGRLFLFTFTEAAPEGGVSRQQLQETFADGWHIESVDLVRGEVSPAFAAEHPDAFPEGGPKGWFAVIRREV